ncbi:MAG: tetratricopeptide repeat protein [Alphaproteobacteria bacterium]|nr:tetratricopeptide repeat protein [Alphaproteobacteria bacterium]MBU0832961.1 tetratricopeptide repeat protein [Alphaproteobacteria bacterium]MBU1764569.1 tetratricopeptide repeat protein [Alphaproteobacteria bacterium]
MLRLARNCVLTVVLLVWGLGVAAGPSNAVIIEADPVPTCPPGQVFDSGAGQCATDRTRVSDADLMANAKRRIDEERFEEARALLDAVRQKNSARYFNYRGFVTRKLGDPEGALIHYRRALILDPYYAEAREYLGEAFLMLGRIEDAEAELIQIGRICGVECEPYLELSEALAEVKGR